MPVPENDGNIVKRTSQYLNNLEHDEPTQAKGVAIYGTPDGNNVYRLKVNSDGSINTSGGAGASNYAVAVDDYTTANVIYVGKAAIGSVSTDAVWQIKKVDATSGAIINWADGNDSFDNVWGSSFTSGEVSSLTYS